MATHKPVSVEDLYGDLTPGLAGRRWWVIYTKSRQEKKLATYARQREISYYLPLQESVRHYRYRKLIFSKPLFSGYIFVKCDNEEKNQLTLSGCVVNFLEVVDEVELVHELQQIFRGQQKGADLRPAEFVKKGTRVEIVAGPFTGLTGVVKDHNNVYEVLLQVHLLHQAVAVVASTDQIKVVK
ncbi:MAG: hypothetical protein JXB60_08670 [Candidatus Cloacimonetes bacterium]|nr:hypothetical protein [Candidatus Cloacimonadota bacterium]